MKKILKNERTNERASERIEQKFMNETREIEEAPFFRHDNRLFRQFLENIEDCYEQYFVNNNKEISQLRPMKVWKKKSFSAYFRFFFGWKRKFHKNWTGSYFEHC